MAPGECELSTARFPMRRDERKAAVDRFQIVPHLAALGAAYVLALPIAWDREKGDRSAGLRIFPLVAIAACGFIQAAESLLVNSPEGIARIVEGVITGIGLIGGGAILNRAPSESGLLWPRCRLCAQMERATGFGAAGQRTRDVCSVDLSGGRSVPVALERGWGVRRRRTRKATLCRHAQTVDAISWPFTRRRLRQARLLAR
jgi:hypothetical protein